MTTEEILQAVSEGQPELMAKTAQIMAITERLHPEFVPGIVQDFETICSVVKEKTAQGNPAQPFIRPLALHVGGTVAGGLLGAIATDLYDAAKRGLSKGSNYRRIMEANPTLKRDVDKRQLSMAYDALHRYAPDFTADPLIGGALLKNIAELPNMSHKTIVELIGAQKNIAEGKGRHFAEMAKLGPVLTSADVERTRDISRKAERAEEAAGRASQFAAEQASRAEERAARASQSVRQEAIRHRYAKKLEDYRRRSKP
jgi:hypothetical protein